MSCPGLHCAGCGAGISVPPVAFAAAFGLAWVAEHIIEIAVTSAACGILAIAAVVALMRRQERREAARAARGTLFVTRADAAPLPPPSRPAIAPQTVNIYSFGADATRAAAAIRQAIDGRTDHDLP